MVIAVIAVVVVLVFLVSGYWINREGQVDRQGLLQLSSMPTGATVTIDGSELPWIERTNMSKILSSGEHTITLSREGHDTWTKTINVTEGLLYRIHYPRLFLTTRTKEKVLDTTNVNAATISPDHSYAILMNNTTEWEAVDLNNETIKPTKIAVTDLFMTTANLAKTQSAAPTETEAKAGTETGTTTTPTADPAAQTTPPVAFDGQIQQISWDRDSSHALFKVQFGDTVEWLLLDVKSPQNSVNITRQYGSNFSEVQILDNSSNNLLVVQNGNLHKIDLGAKVISNVLVEKVVNFDHYNQNEIVFAAETPNPREDEAPYYVGSFKIGDSQVVKLEETTQPAQVTLSKFYEDKYITVLVDNQLTVHRHDDFSPLAEFSLTFQPSDLVVGHNGEFQTMRAGGQIATLDMESMSLTEWQLEDENGGWIDNDMIYTVKDGELVVYDYDGLNRRAIISGVSAQFPVAITDDKWLYYFADGQLMREWLIQH